MGPRSPPRRFFYPRSVLHPILVRPISDRLYRYQNRIDNIMPCERAPPPAAAPSPSPTKSSQLSSTQRPARRDVDVGVSLSRVYPDSSCGASVSEQLRGASAGLGETRPARHPVVRRLGETEVCGRQSQWAIMRRHALREAVIHQDAASNRDVERRRASCRQLHVPARTFTEEGSPLSRCPRCRLRLEDAGGHPFQRRRAQPQRGWLSKLFQSSAHERQPTPRLTVRDSRSAFADLKI